MNAASFIFFAVFVLPLAAFLIYIARQDKKKGITGLIVVSVIVIVAIVYMFIMTKGK